MNERSYERINDYSAITIQLASPNDIRSWSYGEVKNPETINYRSYKAEKDGLFCERIFGPEKDWECSCGKYKGIKYKDIICDRCGVKITHSKVRRSRMGHINLAAPIVHIWFFKAMPSRLGNLLGMKTAGLQQVVYFQKYLVVRGCTEKCPHKCKNPLKKGDLLTEDEYRRRMEECLAGVDPRPEKETDMPFIAKMGAEAVRDILAGNRELEIEGLDLEKLAKMMRMQLKYSQLRRDLKKTESDKKSKAKINNEMIALEAEAAKIGEQLRKTESKQEDETTIKRLRIVEKLKNSENQPEWMVFDVIPVIPPDLRPLVPLESGNFATSDLNDLYRRVINRNNRMKKLLELNAPGVIIRNEKRMLQQAVDALFDNSRCKRSVMGSGNRPLKSLTDMIKGKQGRFRENLLGKRVDYSARSVIVVGPSLKLHECGLPKKIALELFQPFIIRKLKERGYADTIKSAKKMLERRAPEVWDVLEEVIKGHPVMLNRAPTLHRMGIQAFMPVLIEGDAITLHPLVCHSFNADFDGDQMAVHLPLSLESQVEAELLMLSTENIFSPSDGNPIISADQDIVLGCYYLTCRLVEESAKTGDRNRRRLIFKDNKEVFLAYGEHKVKLHEDIYINVGKGRNVILNEDEKTEDEELRVWEERQREKGIYRTTVGRVIFNDVLPEGMPFYNTTMHKRAANNVISDCCDLLGRKQTIKLLDKIKELGFHSATMSGMSFSARDLIVPEQKEHLVGLAEKRVGKIESDYQAGVLSQGERYNQIIDVWTHATNQIEELLMQALAKDTLDGKPYLNPIYVMATSAARGNATQIRQLAGMRGLMAKPSGKIIETPIKANFREGLRGLEYFSSTHGARKGLADTALKTADSGYLTRKLVEVAQDVIVTCDDCGTLRGIPKGAVYRADKVEVTLSKNIRGRVARDNIVNLITDEVVVRENELITDDKARKIEDLDFLGVDPQIMVRSPLTCEADFGACAKCYGMDLSTGRLVEEGTAVGVIAAQSIGEPGTQLTMRTFHIGGTATRALEKAEIRALCAGSIGYKNMQSVENRNKQTVVLSRKGEVVIHDEKGREVEKHSVPLGAVLNKKSDEKAKKGEVIATWDAHSIPVLSARGGRVKFEDIVPGITVKEEIDPRTKVKRMVVVEFKGDKHPVIVIEDKNGERLCHYDILEKAHIEVAEGELVEPGHLLAKTPREITGTQDITGGLPRVTELFEARRPKDPAIISEIDGIVTIGEKKRGKRTIVVENEITGMRKEHLVPPGKPILVHGGERVRAGDQLVAGSPVPHDVLGIRGETQLQQYLLREIQAVYRSQKVPIDDKHIEILIKQMLRKVKITDPGDTEFLPGDVVSKSVLKTHNKAVIDNGGSPAQSEPMLLGVARASLQSESFVAAASFQETTKVLTEAAIAGRKDELRGLKENVILGHIVPAGTGFPKYWHSEVRGTAMDESAAREAEEIAEAEARELEEVMQE